MMTNDEMQYLSKLEMEYQFLNKSDTREPSDERKAELEAAYEAQKDTDAPYQGVKIRTLGELQWIMKQRDWSGKFPLPDGMERANLAGAQLRRASLPYADLGEANLTKADLNGANLAGANLYKANLTEADLIKSYLVDTNLSKANLAGADLGEADLTKADLFRANLTGANLYKTTLVWADLREANLTKANLYVATLPRADLTRSLTNAETVLDGIFLDTRTMILSVRWNGVPLDEIDWQQTDTFGEETGARTAKHSSRKARVQAFQDAARAYHGLVVALELQGLTQPARKFHRRERMMERRALRANPLTWPAWAFRALLNLVAGEGENPERAFISYVLLILGFAFAYFGVSYAFPTPQIHNLPFDQALVLSLTSFHGRAFFAGNVGLGDAVARIASAEAVIGLFIEIVFIATFSRRFLGD